MANTALMVSSLSAGVATTAASARFAPLSGMLQFKTPESTSQIVVRNAGNFKKLLVLVQANSSVGTNTVKFSKNGTAMTLGVNCAGTTGTFEDTTSVETTVAGDKLTWVASADTSGTMTVVIISCHFDDGTGGSEFSSRNFMQFSATLTYTTGSSYSAICGQMATNASNEPGIQTKMLKAATMKYLQCTITANAKTATTTFASRKNTAAGSLTLSIPSGAGGVGTWEDTTNVDTISVNDLWNTTRIAGTDTTNATTWTSCAIDHVTTSGNFFILQTAADADVAGTASATRYCAVGGQLTLTSTSNSNLQTKLRDAFTFSNMSVEQTGAGTNTVAWALQKNGTNTTLTVTAGTASGQYTNTSASEAMVSTDTINLAATYGAGTAPPSSKATVYGYFAANVLTSYPISETLTLTESAARKLIKKFSIAETIALAETKVRKVIRNIYYKNVSALGLLTH